MNGELLCWSALFVHYTYPVWAIGRAWEDSREVRRELRNGPDLGAQVAQLLDEGWTIGYDREPVTFLHLDIAGQSRCEGRARSLLAGTAVCSYCADRAVTNATDPRRLFWPIGEGR